MSIYGVVIFALSAAVLIIVVKQTKPELALPLSVAVGAILLTYGINSAAPLVIKLKAAVEPMNVKTEYISLMLKSLGICYITQFAGETCCDFGQTALGSKIELLGRVTLAALNLPLAISLINTVVDLAG